MATECRRLEELLQMRRPVSSSSSLVFPSPGLFSSLARNRELSKEKNAGNRKTSGSLRALSPPSRVHHQQTLSLRRRYACTKCPYSTDRRDLYTRHENIHRDEKPFRCYVCNKMFNRADHVKKHFLRIHKGLDYDVKLTKRVKGIDYEVGNGKGTLLLEQSAALKSQQSNLASQFNHRTFTSQLMSQVLEATNAFYLPKMAAGLSAFPNAANFSISAANIVSNTIAANSQLNSDRLRSAITKLSSPLVGVKKEKTDSDVSELKLTPDQSNTQNALRLKSSDVELSNDSTQLDGQVHLVREEDKSMSSSSTSAFCSSVATSRSPSPPQLIKTSVSTNDSFAIRKEEKEMLDRVVVPQQQSLSFKDQLPKSRFFLPLDENSSESSHECDICGCAFADYQSLHTHRFLLHRYLVENCSPYCCAICGRRSITQRAMIKHMREHSNSCSSSSGNNSTSLVKSVVTRRFVNSPATKPNSLVEPLESDEKPNKRKQTQPRKIVKSDEDDESKKGPTSRDVQVEHSQDKTANSIAIGLLTRNSNFVCTCGQKLVTYTQYIQHRKFFKH